MIYRFVTKASVEERITQVWEKDHQNVLYILVVMLLLKLTRSLSVMFFFQHIFVLPIGGEEEDDAHPFGGATWSRLQNRLHV